MSTGVWTQLPDHPGRAVNFAWRFTTSGIVLGSACGGTLYVNIDCVGWTWDGQKYSIFTVPAATGGTGLGTMATSVNNRGEIVGYYSDAAGQIHPFHYDRGVFTTIDPSGEPDSNWMAYDVNNSGQVLLFPSLGVPFPTSPSLIYDHGRFTELPKFPGDLVTVYMGLNDSGQLTGLSIDENFAGHPFIATKK